MAMDYRFRQALNQREYQRRFSHQLRRERIERAEAQAPPPGKARRDWWAEQTWTCKVCVICGHPSYVLHHAKYTQSDREPFHLVPLCASHHYLLEFTFWPWLRRWLTREQATLFVVVHGERLLRLRSPETSPQTQLF